MSMPRRAHAARSGACARTSASHMPYSSQVEHTRGAVVCAGRRVDAVDGSGGRVGHDEARPAAAENAEVATQRRRLLLRAGVFRELELVKGH
eukprot:3566554-Pleurochrysis_carterae.AAC.4